MPVSVHIWLSNLTYEGALPYMQNICAHIRHSTDKYMAYDSNIWQHNLHIWPIYDISVWVNQCSDWLNKDYNDSMELSGAQP